MSDDPDWPHHSNKEWRQTLEIARAAGWSFKKYSSHGFGIIQCPEGICRQSIMSTASGTESVARSTRRRIQRCVHRPDLVERTEAVRRHLEKAALLLEGAERLLDLADAEKVLEMLGDAENAVGLLEEVDQHLREAQRLRLHESFDSEVERISQLETDARMILGDPPPNVAQLLDDAATPLRDAKMGLRDVPAGHADHTSLDEELHRLQAWREHLRSRTP